MRRSLSSRERSAASRRHCVSAGEGNSWFLGTPAQGVAFFSRVGGCEHQAASVTRLRGEKERKRIRTETFPSSISGSHPSCFFFLSSCVTASPAYYPPSLWLTLYGPSCERGRHSREGRGWVGRWLPAGCVDLLFGTWGTLLSLSTQS